MEDIPKASIDLKRRIYWNKEVYVKLDHVTITLSSVFLPFHFRKVDTKECPKMKAII